MLDIRDFDKKKVRLKGNQGNIKGIWRQRSMETAVGVGRYALGLLISCCNSCFCCCEIDSSLPVSDFLVYLDT